MKSVSTIMEEIGQACGFINSVTKSTVPEVGLVLGSGLGQIADLIENRTVIKYSDIPHFPVSTAPGHKGNLIFGELAGKSVVAMQGRIHYYEGYSVYDIAFPIRVMVKLGIKYLFVSNAAGGVNTDYRVGDLMVMKDQINMLPNPLVGPNLDDFGPRFPDMTHPFDYSLIALADEVAAENGFSLRHGVFFGHSGPTYETPAEYGYIRTLGGDAVAMSTTTEVITARHSDIPVLGVSVITNETRLEFDVGFKNDEQDVIIAANAASERLTTLFLGLLKKL